MSKLWRGLAAALAAVMVITALAAMPSLLDSEEADAAVAADFNAGYIISDENFYNGSAMTAAQISSWLQTKNAGCIAGKRCILNYSENTPTMAADAYCGRIEGKKNESAASVIARVGKACNLSQKALLVLLEKEQSLVSLRDVPNWKWESATGYGCPDTAPCDAGFGGFFTQVYFGARAYQYYKAHPTQYRHQPFATNNVLYNPNGACGSSRVYIQNYATAGLYNYTPYQPNRAAMNNLYGVGDSCSAYGNRNFWRMYTDWFGDPTGKPAHNVAEGLVTTAGSDRVWVVSGGNRHAVYAASVGHWTQAFGTPRTISASQLESLKVGYSIDRGFKSGDRAWQMYRGKRTEFSGGCSGAADFGYNCAKLPSVTMSLLYKFSSAGSMKNLVGWSGGGWWWVEDGVRHQVPNFGMIKQMGLSESRSWFSGNAISHLPVGDPMMPNGSVAHNKTTGQKYLATKGGFLALNAAQAKQSQFASAGWLWEGSVNAMSNAMPITDKPAYGSKTYLLGEKGLVVVKGLHFGGTSKFQAMKVPMLWGVPTDTPRNGSAVLVQQIGKSQIWLVQNGKKQPVSSSQLKSLEARYGKVVRTASDVAAGLPTTSKTSTQVANTAEGLVLTQLRSGDLVERTATGDQYIYSESDGLVAVEDAAFAAALGIDDEPTLIEEDAFEQLEVTDAVLDTWGITCGDQSYFAADGRLYPFAQNALQHYPLGFAELPEDICATLVVSSVEVGQIVQDADEQIWEIREGRKHLATEAWLAENPVDQTLFTVPDSYLTQVPTGTNLE